MHPDRVLRWAPSIAIQLRDGSPVVIRADGAPIATPASAPVLAVLDLFAQPRSFRAAIEQLQASGQHDFIAASRLLFQLERAGVLVDASGARPPAAPTGFDAPSIHVAMLDDTARTQCFLDAIREQVRPGDVVVDLGTGTGILAIAAARAGASRVYAIEQGAIADAAAKVIAANGASKVVQVVRGRSTRVELPERADILISEILGGDPLDESVLEIFRDAHQRFLKPRARVVPRALTVYGLPVDLPEDFVARATFEASAVARWRAAYGVDFEPLLDYGRGMARLRGIKAQEARAWHAVGEACVLTSIALDDTFEVAATKSASFVATRAAERLGVLLYFEAALSPSVTLSTSPVRASATNHWPCMAWRSLERPRVAEGERVHIDYTHDGANVDVRIR